jgi:copper chaperone CopZ
MSSLKRMVVKGMTCDHCESSVALALESAGAQEIEVSYRKGEAVFRGGEDALLANAVREAGYRPGPIESLEPVPAVRSGDGSRDYDLLVLGSGSAAFAAAIRASRGEHRRGNLRQRRLHPQQGLAARRRAAAPRHGQPDPRPSPAR